MYRYNTPLEDKCVQLEKLLKEAREEARYYQGIAEENGIKCFREIDQLSKIINYRKQSEEILRENEEKYRTVMEAHPDPVIVYDMNGRVVFLNPAFTRFFGWTLQERVG